MQRTAIQCNTLQHTLSVNSFSKVSYTVVLNDNFYLAEDPPRKTEVKILKSQRTTQFLIENDYIANFSEFPVETCV